MAFARMTGGILLAGGMLLGLAACHSGSGYQYGFYDTYGRHCGNSPYAGCTYRYNGAKISIYDDPYSGMVSYDAYWGYCDSFNYCTSTWWSPSGVWYGYNGYALNEGASERGRDMGASLAEQEERATAETAAIFASKSGLAEEKALEIVTTLRDWERLTRGRGRTEKDLDDLSKRLLGKGFAESAGAVASLKAGDAKPMRALEADVAQLWNTDVETVREALRAVYER